MTSASGDSTTESKNDDTVGLADEVETTRQPQDEVDMPPHHWNLYEQLTRAIYLSDLVYDLAILRGLAREKKLLSRRRTVNGTNVKEDEDAFLRLPMTLYEGHETLANSSMAAKVIGLIERERVVKKLEKMLVQTRTDLEKLGKLSGLEYNEAGKKVVLIDMGDLNSQNEMVYFIGVDHIRKMINVVFRGSSTINDFRTDLNVVMMDLPNPLEREMGRVKCIQIHQGFFDYLFLRETGEDVETGEPETTRAEPPYKIDYILHQVIDILREHPEYTVNATGHSLGAALATLFAFYIATSSKSKDVITHPVLCVNVASPMAGNRDFREAFHHLEKKGKIRQLRVVNQDDVIPRCPTRAWQNDYCVALSLENVYVHVGMKLKFRPRPWNMDYVLSFGNVRGREGLMRYRIKAFFWRYALTLIFCILGCWPAYKTHSIDEYKRRVDLFKESLEKLTLDELYQKVIKDGERGVIKRG